jgi:CubicO group peptidase (beta-lactamase class C family)
MTKIFMVFLTLIIYSCGSSRKDNFSVYEETQEQNLISKLDSIIAPFIDSGFVGVVLVANPNKIVLNKAYGKNRTTLDSNSVFWIASNTKPITAVAVMKLVEDGKLSIKDSLPQFFKNVPSDKIHITVEHLLTHTSGLPDDITEGEGINDRDVAIKKILSAKLISEPGEKENYTNNGYELLEEMIELRSKKTYQAFLREAIFAKAGMTNSNFIGDNNIIVDPPSESKAYQELHKKEFKNGMRTPVLFLGAGGISNNTIDLYKMMVALKGGQILNQNSLTELFKPTLVIQQKGDTILSWAYGWVIKSINEKIEIRHSGRSTWIHNNRIFYLDNGYKVIIWARDNGPDNKAWATELSYPLVKEINLLEKANR